MRFTITLTTLAVLFALSIYFTNLWIKKDYSNQLVELSKTAHSGPPPQDFYLLESSDQKKKAAQLLFEKYQRDLSHISENLSLITSEESYSNDSTESWEYNILSFDILEHLNEPKKLEQDSFCIYIPARYISFVQYANETRPFFKHFKSWEMFLEYYCKEFGACQYLNIPDIHFKVLEE
jgi:hypothetical protein